MTNRQLGLVAGTKESGCRVGGIAVNVTTLVAETSMDGATSATDANRRFSELLRTVKKGRSVVVTSHGKPVARITPVIEDNRDAEGARSTEGANGAVMRDRALKLIQRLPPRGYPAAGSDVGRKARRRPGRAREAVLSWRDAYAVVETSATVIVNATDLTSDHGLTIWDLVVLAASAEAECRLLLSDPRRVYVAWSHRHEPVCAQRFTHIGGIAHGALGVST